MPILSSDIPLSLYVHLPWCIKKCPYCDFNSHALNGNIPESSYVNALLADFELALPLIKNRSLVSIFFGGGTPSLFSGKAIQALLTFFKNNINFDDHIEITLEANPGASDEKRFAEFYNAGVNRLSIGIQSFNTTHLKKLGRIHQSLDAKNAIIAAKNAGFINFNLDLMYGLPNQTPNEAIADLEEALTFSPPHLSWYQLTLEPNTLFYHERPPLPNDDLIFSIEQEGKALLKHHALYQYEVSAYAKENHFSRHNKNYWEFGDYLGIGAGAHSKISVANNIIRFMQPKHPRIYMLEAGVNLAPQKYLTSQEISFEFMLNAMRLNEGFSTPLFIARTGLSFSHIEKTLKIAQKKGLLTLETTQIKASPQGQLYLNDLIGLFLN